MSDSTLHIGALASNNIVNDAGKYDECKEKVKDLTKEIQTRKDIFEKMAEPLVYVCDCYQKFNVVTGMPKSTFGDSFGYDMQKDISSHMSDFYAGKVSRDELSSYFEECCTSMRTYRTSQHQTSGTNESDNTQIVSEMYEVFAKENALVIEYRATTDKATVVNLTNHGFFNLAGISNPTPTIENNIVTINANFYTPIDEVSIPTGEVAKVEGTPMDFTTPHTVGERINDKFQQLINGAGYDHCYVLNKIETGSLDLAATCFEPNSGRTMEVYTTEAGVQLYTGNWLNGFEGAHGATFPARSAICFEAQCFPDTPNKPHFPSATLLPGDEYQQVTIYKFGVEK